MRLRYKPERAGQRHRVDRNPKTHVLTTTHVVIRLILVPRRCLLCAGFLDQQVIVIKTHSLRPHELRRQMGQGGIEQNALIAWVRGPGTEVFNEAPRIIGLAGHLHQVTQMRQIVFNALFKCLNFLRVENTTQHNSAQALIAFNGFGRQHMCSRHRTHIKCFSTTLPSQKVANP